MSPSPEKELSGWLADAIINCQPIDQEHVDAINTFLPGLHSLAIAIIFPNEHHHVLQTCFILDLDKQPCTGRSAIFSGIDSLLAKTVYETGKALLCPASKSTTFADVENLLKGSATCSSAACIPLLQQPPSSLQNNNSTQTPNTRSFGSLCISFQHDIIPKETVAAAHSLSRALASFEHGLRAHGATILDCLRASMHPSTDPSVEDLNDDVDDYDSDCADDNEASCSRSIQERTAPAPAAAAPFQSCLMTFQDSTLEKNYLAWTAQHMRCLDPAATLFICFYYCAIGFSPSFKMASNHLLMYAAGWIVLVPLLLCLLPGINHIYLAHREMCLLIFHAISATWQVTAANTTKYLGPSLFIHFSKYPAATFAWQFLNLVMFQVRWQYVLVISAILVVTSTIPLAPGLCKLFEEHELAKDNCIPTTIFFGVVHVLAAIIVLRFNEYRMRRLFLNSLQNKQH